MLRWTIRILLLFSVLIIMAAVIVHFVLRSAWLGEMILARASEALGMEVVSESLDVGWGGSTTIREAAVKMPLTGEVVLSANRIEVKHEVIPLLILGRPVNVQSVEVDSPRVNLRHYESGRWNVQDVWTRLRASFDSSEEQKGRPARPQIVIQDAVLHITEPDAVAQTVGPLDLRAHPQGRLLWLFDLEWPEVVGVKGQVVPGGDWAHAVGFEVGDIGPVIHQLLGGDLSPLQMTGCWEGKVLQDSVSGMLRLDKLAVGSVAARGDVRVQATAGQVTVSPRGLTFSEPNLAGREIRLAGGSIRITREHVELEQLAAVSNLLTARLNGHWDWSTRAGEFSGSLAAATPRNPNEQQLSGAAAGQGQLPRYDGTFAVAVKSPQFGRKAAKATVSIDADTSLGEVNLAVNVEASGADWQQSQWLVSVPAMLWSREGKQVDLTGTAAEVHVAWPEIRLASLKLPGTETANADARFNVNTRQWSAHMAADGAGQLKPWGLESLDFRLNAKGDDRTAVISEFRVTQGERIVTAEGELSFYERGFQDVRVTADWPASSAPPQASQAKQPIGRWHLEGDILGRLEPRTLNMAGQLTGQNIAVGQRRIKRLEVPVRADADPGEIRMATDSFELLGGIWQLSGQHDLSLSKTQVSVVADDLSLEAAAGMAGLPLTSRGQAQTQIQLAIKGLDLDSAVATGSWSASDVNIPPLVAERARGKLRIADGLVRFDEIVLQQKQGRAEANMEFRLDNPQEILFELKAEEWPVYLSSLVARGSALKRRGQVGAPQVVNPNEKRRTRNEAGPALFFEADGEAKLRLNMVRRTATGEARVSGKFLLNEQSFARIRALTLVREQTLDIQGLYAETLGGSVEGRATIALNQWRNSEAQLRWQGIEPKQLQTWVPQLGRFEGVVSGTLAIDQMAKEARPPEPMRFVLDADIENGRFGPATVDICQITGYLGATRLLIDNACLKVLDGRLDARARVSKHADRYYGSLVVDFNDLNLKQLVHTIDPNAGEYIGNLSGTATLLASSGWDSFGGEARISLAESDLVRNPIVKVLHNSLNLQFGERQPTGSGEVTVRLEGPSVVIPSFSYFNRGVEIRGAGQIKDVSLGADSPIEGFAVASTRVLKGITLPGVRSLDRLLATFQTGAASAQIDGTLGTVEVKVVPLPVVLGSFRRLLWAQLGG